jgi:hypothetical protein
VGPGHSTSPGWSLTAARRAVGLRGLQLRQLGDSLELLLTALTADGAPWLWRRSGSSTAGLVGSLVPDGSGGSVFTSTLAPVPTPAGLGLSGAVVLSLDGQASRLRGLTLAWWSYEAGVPGSPSHVSSLYGGSPRLRARLLRPDGTRSQTALHVDSNGTSLVQPDVAGAYGYSDAAFGTTPRVLFQSLVIDPSAGGGRGTLGHSYRYASPSTAQGSAECCRLNAAVLWTGPLLTSGLLAMPRLIVILGQGSSDPLPQSFFATPDTLMPVTPSPMAVDSSTLEAPLFLAALAFSRALGPAELDALSLVEPNLFGPVLPLC